jgi:hypothetical protein
MPGDPVPAALPLVVESLNPPHCHGEKNIIFLFATTCLEYKVALVDANGNCRPMTRTLSQLGILGSGEYRVVDTSASR